MILRKSDEVMTSSASIVATAMLPNKVLDHPLTSSLLVNLGELKKNYVVSCVKYF